MAVSALAHRGRRSQRPGTAFVFGLPLSLAGLAVLVYAGMQARRVGGVLLVSLLVSFAIPHGGAALVGFAWLGVAVWLRREHARGPASIMNLGIALTLLAGSLVLVSGVSAAPVLPRLGIVSARGSIRVVGHARAGATVLHFTTSRHSSGPSVIRLRPGVTVRAFSRKLDALQAPPDSLQKYGTFVSGAEIARGHGRTLTVRLTSGTYVVADTDGTNPRRFARTSFTVRKASHPAPLPSTRATISLRDFRFSSPKVIHPGLVRIINRGTQLHFIDAIPVPAGTSAAHVVHLLRQGMDSKVRVPATSLLGLVSPRNRQRRGPRAQARTLRPRLPLRQQRLPRQGTHELGMERAVEIR